MAETESIKARRQYTGPAILELGFRPFFLLAGIWALIPLTLWILIYMGLLSPITSIDVQAWHAHEMIFGYAGAALAGFALTAIPNWTGRLPVRGNSLLILVLMWLTARTLSVVALFSDMFHLAAIMEGLFFISFSALVCREIFAGKNWRNMPVALMFSIFTVAAISSNLESLSILETNTADHFGIAILITLISLIGGRIIPSFTTNWLKQQGVTKLPVSFNQNDGLIILVSIAALISWLSLPINSPAIAIAGGLCCILHFWRLSRWCGLATVSEPLVLMLHIAYLWIPIGFGLMSLSSLDLINETAVVHTWTVGAIASMTIAVMMRAALGHSGRALKADVATTALFAMLTLAVITRIYAAATSSIDGILYSTFFWIGAYSLYIATYLPVFFHKKKS